MQQRTHLSLALVLAAATLPGVASAGDLVSAGSIEIEATLSTASGSTSWHELYVRLSPRTIDGKQLVEYPVSFCDQYSLPKIKGECLRPPLPPDSIVVSMTCIDDSDVGPPAVITPLADSYRVRDVECDVRKYQTDRGTLAFGDTCMHPHVSAAHIGTTLTYFNEEARTTTGWAVPTLSGEHTFSCRWLSSSAAPQMRNPKIRFYIQGWEPETIAKGGEDHGWVDNGGRDFGQVKTGDSKRADFRFHNLGWNSLEFDSTSGVTVTGPSADVTVSAPQLAVNQPARDYSRHGLHAEPPVNIIGRGGVFDYAAELRSGQPGPTQHFTVTATPKSHTSGFHAPIVHLWYTPVASCKPEINLPNFGSVWISPVTAEGTLLVKLHNRGCADLTVTTMSVAGPDAAHFQIDTATTATIAAHDDFPVRVTFTAPQFPYIQVQQFIADLVIESDSIDVDAPMPGFDPYSVGGVSAVKLEVSTIPEKK